MTLAEHSLLLEADPNWMAMQATQAAKLAALKLQFRREQAELISDIQSVGLKIESVWDLVNTSMPYPTALPVLLNHLQRPYSANTREGIARALAVKAARPLAWDTLTSLARNGSLPGGVTEGIMAAICAMARPADVPCLIDLLADRSIGNTRCFLIANLRRSKRPEARQALIDNRHDPDLATEIDRRLGRNHKSVQG
ncbi:hypothetical protein KZ810_04905 [Sphingomonas sp. RHCKR47]|uniref:hypothetical protein n=1 Tax=Sphingomonas citricola TaxID=2862498 RepID=UPI001CA4B125|nr:hypothetical protein [Sphingomonas citricola]MBW6522831.1 hypothetical protein [Sphingomonas citricola]